MSKYGTQINIRLNDELSEKLGAEAEMHGTTPSGYVRHVLSQVLAGTLVLQPGRRRRRRRT